MTDESSRAHDASGPRLYPPSHTGPKKPGGQLHLVQAGSRIPPLRQTRVHSEHVGPDLPAWQRHEQSLRVVEPAEQLERRHPTGGAGFATTNPAVDSIPHISMPRTIRKKPDSPQSVPHEFWQIQYGTP